MGIPYTESGYNMYDMLSTIQKGIRRGNYELAGWGAQQLQGTYRTVMWNRMYVISSEDCFGILTKELVALREKDTRQIDNRNIANAMALLCKSKKSRDACYFSCNFVLDSRERIKIDPDDERMGKFLSRMESYDHDETEYDEFGFGQLSMFEEQPVVEENANYHSERDLNGCRLQVALEHRDMDMIGWYIDRLRYDDRKFLWNVLEDYARTHAKGILKDEITALRLADNMVNGKKAKDRRDEIFIAKAAMLICYAEDEGIGNVRSSGIICPDHTIDWRNIKVKPISECKLADGKIPEYVFDCHTLKGKKAGKTDWDMTRDEQLALYPLEPDYFSEASWIYTYEQDYRMGRMNDREMAPIREFAQTHPANPVEPYPYE